MYSYIKGTVADYFIGGAIIENNGIGYEIFLSDSTLYQLPSKGGQCMIHLYQVVREDELSLYGFLTLQEKNMFIKLISVSGIGPKLALSVLSGIKLDQLTTAIITGDSRALSGIKGIGKKTAERIILELKENVENTLSELTVERTAVDNAVNSALEVLEGMGLSRSIAYEKVVKARQGTSDIAEIVRIVLKGLKSNG